MNRSSTETALYPDPSLPPFSNIYLRGKARQCRQPYIILADITLAAKKHLRSGIADEFINR